MNIVLAGMPASGKTTVSVELGKLIGSEVVDMDGLIVSRYGEINAIFEKYGEERFRDIESEIVGEVSALDNKIISTGGGCLLRESNVALLRKNGKIIFLQTSLQTLIKRSEGDTSRPLLKGDAARKLECLLKVREPVYLAAADFTVWTDGLTPQQIARKIEDLIK